MSTDPFQQGQRVWVHTPGGAVPAIYVGGGDNATFFGGPALAYVVIEEGGGRREGIEVELDRVTARD